MHCIPNIKAFTWDALAEASKQGHLVVTSTTRHRKVWSARNRTRSLEFVRQERVYSSTFILDYCREATIENDGCAGNHRTHEAAVKCGQRTAARNGILGAQRLEDAAYI